MRFPSECCLFYINCWKSNAHEKQGRSKELRPFLFVARHSEWSASEMKTFFFALTYEILRFTWLRQIASWAEWQRCDILLTGRDVRGELNAVGVREMTAQPSWIEKCCFSWIDCHSAIVAEEKIKLCHNATLCVAIHAYAVLSSRNRRF